MRHGRGEVNCTLAAVITVIGLAGVAGLAACADSVNAVTAAPAPASVPALASVALCRNAARTDRVVVSEAPEFNLRHPRPAKAPITIADVRTVRALASQLCSFRVAPHGWADCPPDAGAGYRLVFHAARHQFRPVTARLSGCHFVSGLGPVRLAAPEFWPLIDHALVSAAHP